MENQEETIEEVIEQEKSEFFDPITQEDLNEETAERETEESMDEAAKLAEIGMPEQD